MKFLMPTIISASAKMIFSYVAFGVKNVLDRVYQGADFVLPPQFLVSFVIFSNNGVSVTFRYIFRPVTFEIKKFL